MSRPYDHKAIEKKLYSHWMEKGYFGAKPDPDKKPFTIVIPRPTLQGNCTWAMHWTKRCRIS